MHPYWSACPLCMQVLVTVERTCTDAILGPGSEVLKFWEQRLGRGYGSPYALVATAEEPHR